MFHKLMAAAASAAILVAAPAFAQGHSGGGAPGGAPGGGMGHANGNSMPSTMPTAPTAPTTTTTTPTTGTTTDTNFSTNSQATVHSQGPANASPNGIAHANSNSVLAPGAVSSTTLPGLTTGLAVNNSTGTQVGTISRVITGPNNTIRAVVVTTASGKTYTLPPSSLTISGSVVTTTSTTIPG